MLAKPKKIQHVYLDHAAATPTAPAVLSAMLPYFTEQFGNPSAIYKHAQAARQAVESSRQTIARILRANSENIIFTSGGTEANNLAIFGVAKASAKKGQHIISLAIEHESVLESLEALKQWGYEITYIPVDKSGLVDPAAVLKAIRSDTVLMSVMYANNEIGTIEPIAEIGRALLQYRAKNKTAWPYFHTDACQAAGFLSLDVEKLHVDLLTLNAAKMYGPKGSGLLYVRRGVPLQPIMHGGGQERRLRAGTENVPGIVGLAKALEISERAKPTVSDDLRELSHFFWTELSANIPDAVLHGPAIGPDRLPNNLNISVPGLESEMLLLYLDEFGISCSAGSACTDKSLSSSHVLTAIGIPQKQARAAVRFSLGSGTRKQDIQYTLEQLQRIVAHLQPNPAS